MTYEREDAILRMRAKRGTRLVVRGDSMLPLLREGMILEIGEYAEGAAHLGDVVIFRLSGKLVAHRVVARTPSGVVASGDAVPHAVQHVRHDAVLAIVTGVRTGSGPNAARVDGPLFRMRGRIAARTQPARARVAGAVALIRSAVRSGAPWRRSRVQPALVAGLSAIVRADDGALRRAIESVPTGRLVDAIVRHRCAEIVAGAIAALDGTAAEDLRSALRPIVRRHAVQTILQRRDLEHVVGILDEAAVSFALLKGAAQVFRSGPEFVHPSIDIDLLIPRSAAGAAVDALAARGYAFGFDEATQRRYRQTHHHLAPLEPPKRGPQIELHTALAPARVVGLPTDWEALAPHLVQIFGERGTARCLNAFGSALHYAIHSVEVPRLRDIYYCARLLAELDAPQRAELRRLAAADSINPIRLEANFALAARLADLDWPFNPKIERCLGWLSWHDDAPPALHGKQRLVRLYAAAMRIRELVPSA